MQPVFPSDVDIDEPLANFSLCHAGIVSQLHAGVQLPALLDAAERARALAADLLRLFDEEVMPHHADEERELFPAVLRSAQPGEEAGLVDTMVRRLTAEHRSVERLWKELEPAVRVAARGSPARLDGELLAELVEGYLAHARFEEELFLPLAHRILTRDGKHMAALGMALHLRHVRIPGGVGYI